MEVENHLNWTEGLINAIDYIETHLIDGEVLDQNTIARQAYSSPDNFRKVFHLITGYTIRKIRQKSIITLGGFGGYIVLGFPQSIPNVEGEYDFKIKGCLLPISTK